MKSQHAEIIRLFEETETNVSYFSGQSTCIRTLREEIYGRRLNLRQTFFIFINSCLDNFIILL